jgi:lipopolysaccharide/colanic/teichoic acid biosynthesis glycosyltransferase
MSIFPIVLDSRAPHMTGALSLALLPLGESTVLSYFGQRLREATGRAPVVVRDFDDEADYEATLRASGVVEAPSIPTTRFSRALATFEPSDWLFFVDASSVPTDGFDPSVLLANLGETPRLTRHLVTLATNPAGTKERIEFGPDQRVRRVRRYYDAVTWTIVGGVCSSMVPVSALTTLQHLAFDSLVELRSALARSSVPFRDVVVSRPVIDLRNERAYLAFNEKVMASVEPATADSKATVKSAKVHSTARLVGNVVLHPGCTVEERATVVGPAVIGPGARIERGAVVAQCVVAALASVEADTVVRHRVVSGHWNGSRTNELETITPPDETLVTLQNEQERSRWYPSIKAVAEAVLASVALVVLSPILVFIAILIRLDSKGPVFYGDPREAKGGRAFRCLKFRTMRVGADLAQRELALANQMDGPQFKLKHDPRVTRIGHWLRQTSLDELPQLFNVAIGQMGLVGPRPSPFRENQTCVPWREARLSVRPGMTGLWQVCRHDREAGDFHQWIYYDIKYIRHMSLLVDVKIIFATVWALAGKGSVPLSWIIPSIEEAA